MAATVSVVGTELRVIAASSEFNDVEVTIDSERTVAVVTDGEGAPAPGDGCTPMGPAVQCTSSGFTVVRGSLSGGEDRMDASGVPAPVRAILDGGTGVDILIGGRGRDLLDGGPGDDTLIRSPEADTFAGADGRDTVSYAGTADPVRVTIGDGADDGAAGERDMVAADVERVLGGDGRDELIGSDGPDYLDGRTGHDKLYGGEGDDTLVPGEGQGEDDDLLDGGGGLDSVSYDSPIDGAKVTVGDGLYNDGLVFPGDEEQDNVTATVERVLGGPYRDVLVGTDGTQFLVGGYGIDSLSGGGGNDELEGGPEDDDLAGGPGNDILDGGEHADRLDGGSGIDLLDGSLGPDELFGGTGVDRVTYALKTTPVTVSIGTGDDDGTAGEGDYVGSDVENLTGGRGHDVLTGSSANNVFDGGAGGDTYNGLDGIDTVSYAVRSIAVTADIDGRRDDGSAFDSPTVSYRDSIRSDVENIVGGSGADTLTAVQTNGVVNTLDGGGGNDKLKTRDGSATIDRLLCGAGVDQYDRDASDTISLCETAATLP